MTVTAASACKLAPHLPLSEPAAEAWLPRTCFKHGPPGRLGVELELIPRPVAAIPPGGVTGLHRALADLPLHAALTVEPGGQVELSSRPADNLPTVLGDVAADLRLVRRRAADLGWHLTGVGLDPVRTPPRLLRLPRYAQMEAYFDRWGEVEGCGPAGRAMMCATASVQVNVEAATEPPPGSATTPTSATGSTTGSTTSSSTGPTTVAQRWSLLHTIGPALVAAFANSPVRGGRATGWKSTRQAIWLTLDPARARAPQLGRTESAEQAWSRWCLDAPVMLVRREHGSWAAPPGLTFRQWIRAGRRAVPERPPPDLDDLAYHLTTLFPPVRARGHLEVRYLDAQPGPWWPVPVAVLDALLADACAADRAVEACGPVQGRWHAAARRGLDDPELARAALRVVEVAAGALADRPEASGAARAVEAFADRWTSRRRCPADDLLPSR